MPGWTDRGGTGDDQNVAPMFDEQLLNLHIDPPPSRPHLNHFHTQPRSQDPKKPELIVCREARTFQSQVRFIISALQDALLSATQHPAYCVSPELGGRAQLTDTVV